MSSVYDDGTPGTFLSHAVAAAEGEKATGTPLVPAEHSEAGLCNLWLNSLPRSRMGVSADHENLGRRMHEKKKTC